jgi:hypothetical protein
VAIVVYFCIPRMKRNTSTSLRLKPASVFMLLTLLWLTVSIPFVHNTQRIAAKEQIATDQPQSINDNEHADNPLTNTNEENSDSSLNIFSEEYLHHHPDEDQNHSAEVLTHLHHANEASYIAFQGELLFPPPKA